MHTPPDHTPALVTQRRDHDGPAAGTKNRTIMVRDQEGDQEPGPSWSPAMTSGKPTRTASGPSWSPRETHPRPRGRDLRKHHNDANQPGPGTILVPRDRTQHAA